MSMKQWIKQLAILAGVCLIAAGFVILLQKTELGETITWQRQASPGALSKAHAFLEDNCAACHTSVKGPETSKCIVCHANNESLLHRQPTTFHSNIGSCSECHIEHRGINVRPTDMDHVALAKIGLRQLKANNRPNGEDNQLYEQLSAWINQSSAGHIPSHHPEISSYEAMLNCATCHANQDRHFKLFGQDCAQCHVTTKWTIPEFRHPSPRSTDCAQCHQAPPSHYMGHFQMISAKAAGKPHAKVNQCYLCHRTTSWNDIKGIGWYKHH